MLCGGAIARASLNVTLARGQDTSNAQLTSAAVGCGVDESFRRETQ
jgi:hypothetical protein